MLLNYVFVSSSVQFSSFQLLSRVQLFATPRAAACQASLSFTNFWILLKLMSIKSVMPSNHRIFCHPLLLPPWIFPSIRVFSNELLLCIRWPKYWSFSFSTSLSNEYSGMISFKGLWLTGWIFLQSKGLSRVFSNHSSKASILQCLAIFMVQLSHLYMTNYWKNHSFDYMDLCQQSNVSAF